MMLDYYLEDHYLYFISTQTIFVDAEINNTAQMIFITENMTDSMEEFVKETDITSFSNGE